MDGRMILGTIMFTCAECGCRAAPTLEGPSTVSVQSGVFQYREVTPGTGMSYPTIVWLCEGHVEMADSKHMVHYTDTPSAS